jgi:hypothetical protein
MRLQYLVRNGNVFDCVDSQQKNRNIARDALRPQASRRTAAAPDDVGGDRIEASA